MADVYGVTPANIAAELPGLFPGGFTAGTIPAVAQVIGWITAADTIISMQVQDITGAVPAAADKAAVLAKRYIIEWVKAQVIRAAFVGNDPLSVKAAADPYDIVAIAYLEGLVALGAQAAGSGEAASRVVVPYTIPQRDLLITDAQLDADASFRSRDY